MNTKNKQKEIYSFILLFSVLILLIIPGLSNLFNQVYGQVVGILFSLILSVGLTYGIYEISNFVLNKKIDFDSKNNNIDEIQVNLIKNKTWLIFTIISFIYVSLFLYFGISYSLNFQLIPNFQTILLTSLLIFILTNLILLIIPTIDLKDQFVLSIVSFLLFIFFFSFLFITIFYSFATIFLILIMTSISDMTAFFFGKKYGKKKIVPYISPNKTLEGFIAGFIASIVFGVAWYLILLMPDYSISYIPISIADWRIIITIFSVALVAPLGDLFFSKIKRSYNVKDFGKLIPGHGGLLDRIDSHIFTIIISLIIILI